MVLRGYFFSQKVSLKLTLIKSNGSSLDFIFILYTAIVHKLSSQYVQVNDYVLGLLLRPF